MLGEYLRANTSFLLFTSLPCQQVQRGSSGHCKAWPEKSISSLPASWWQCPCMTLFPHCPHGMYVLSVVNYPVAILAEGELRHPFSSWEIKPWSNFWRLGHDCTSLSQASYHWNVQITGALMGDILLGAHHLAVTPPPSTCKHTSHSLSTLTRNIESSFLFVKQEYSTNMICSDIE